MRRALLCQLLEAACKCRSFVAGGLPPQSQLATCSDAAAQGIAQAAQHARVLPAGCAASRPFSSRPYRDDDDDDDAEASAVHAHPGPHRSRREPAHAASAVLIDALSGSSIQERESQGAARQALGDPMSRLLASRGMPLGISLDQGRGGRQASSGDESSDDEDQPGSAQQPGYQMEAIDEVFSTSRLSQTQTPPSVAWRSSGGTSGNTDTFVSSSMAGGAGAGGAGSAGGSGGGSSGDGSGSGSSPGGPQDSWGTTQESPAEIARRLVLSNQELEQQAKQLGQGPAGAPGDDELELVMPPGAEKYQTLEQMSEEIKGLDEVFEVLAQVPWLDEDDLEQKELKGVTQVGLLGTLEEVGFNIRPQLQRIWAGDRDDGMITECEAARDQAALLAILYHTKQIEDKYGAPRSWIPIPGPNNPDQAPPSLVRIMEGGPPDPADATKQGSSRE